MRTGRAGRWWPSLLLLSGVFAALRGPSLVEPTWYADEGTYADIGHALLHGASLYRDVWDNKPPGVYWLAAAVDATLGPHGYAFAALLAVIAAATAAGVAVIGQRAGGGRMATGAALLCIVLGALPNLEGDLFNAEVAGAVLVVWAFVLLTRRSRAGRMPGYDAWVAGALAGLAVLCKAVFVFDVLALVVVPVWAVRAGQGLRPSWKDARRAILAILGGAVAAVIVGVGALAVRGSVGGLADVVLHQDLSYLQRTNGPGGSVLTTASSGHALLDTALLALRVAVPLLVGGGLAWRLAGRGAWWPAVVSGWLGADLAGAMVSSREFPHYVQQAVPAAALAVALVARAAWKRGRVAGPSRLARAGAIVAVLAAWPLLQVAIVLPRAEVAWAHHEPFPPIETDSLRVAQLPQYYQLGWGRAAGLVPVARWDALFPTDQARLRATVALFKRFAGPGDRVFVWGTIHWSYARSGRLPAGRYVSLNSAFEVDPGAGPRLLAELTAHPPAVLIADIPLSPGVSALLQRLHYRRLPGAAAGDDAWIAPSAS